MVKIKIFSSTYGELCLIAALFLAVNIAADNLSTSEKVLKEKPIVIETQVRNYDQPTLKEYEQCHENRDKCLKVCETERDPVACEAQCLVCPILIDHSVVVQGINDTDLKMPVETSVNSTNVIRLTNEIRNIVENNMGDITARNENNVHIHNNVSTIGGKFGLGYNKNGSCCLVVRISRHCELQRFSRSTTLCHKKRHRVCGERCKSRVMYAKRVNYCPDEANCYQKIKYIPSEQYHAQTHYHQEQQQPLPSFNDNSRCQYSPSWPFVACQQSNSAQGFCQRCLNLSYGYILKHGIPSNCVKCYSRNSVVDDGAYDGQNFYAPPQRRPVPVQPYIPGYYPPPWYPQSSFYPNDFGWNNVDDGSSIPEDDGWQVQHTKCRHPNGTIIENCHINSGNGNGSGDGMYPENNDPSNDNNNNIYADPDDESYDNRDELDDELPEVEEQRYRRNAFHRSKYSHRNINKY